MTPCVNCEKGDSDSCRYHPCNGCGADESECSNCQVLINGFDCNMFKEEKIDKICN
jgi:hypothetical protein